MAEKTKEPEKPKPLPSFKVSERTPDNVKNVLKEVEDIFTKSKTLAPMHRSAIEKAREGEEHFDEADQREEIARDYAKSIRKTPPLKK